MTETFGHMGDFLSGLLTVFSIGGKMKLYCRKGLGL